MKQNTSIITQIHIPLLLCSLCFISSLLFPPFMLHFCYLSPRMALSRADTANRRKPEQHCLEFPLASLRKRLRFHAPCFCRGKYGVSSLLDVWVQPVTMWVRAWPQHLHKALPVLPPQRRKGQVFPLVGLIWKECGIPSDSGQTPKYINLLTSRSWKEQHGLDVLAIFFKQSWLFMWGNTYCKSPECKCKRVGCCSVFKKRRRNKMSKGASKSYAELWLWSVISSLAAGQWSCLRG